MHSQNNHTQRRNRQTSGQPWVWGCGRGRGGVEGEQDMTKHRRGRQRHSNTGGRGTGKRKRGGGENLRGAQLKTVRTVSCGECSAAADRAGTQERDSVRSRTTHHWREGRVQSSLHLEVLFQGRTRRKKWLDFVKVSRDETGSCGSGFESEFQAHGAWIQFWVPTELLWLFCQEKLDVMRGGGVTPKSCDFLFRAQNLFI